MHKFVNPALVRVRVQVVVRWATGLSVTPIVAHRGRSRRYSHSSRLSARRWPFIAAGAAATIINAHFVQQFSTGDVVATPAATDGAKIGALSVFPNFVTSSAAAARAADIVIGFRGRRKSSHAADLVRLGPLPGL